MKRFQVAFRESHRRAGNSRSERGAADRTENNREDLTLTHITHFTHAYTEVRTHTHSLCVYLFQSLELWSLTWRLLSAALLLICINKLCICISLHQPPSCLDANTERGAVWCVWTQPPRLFVIFPYQRNVSRWQTGTKTNLTPSFSALRPHETLDHDEVMMFWFKHHPSANCAAFKPPLRHNANTTSGSNNTNRSWT